MHSCTNATDHTETAEPTPTEPPLAPDRKTLDKLLRANERLIRYVVYRYRNRGIEYDDLMQIARIAFCQAVGKHDPARGVFAMFAGFVMQSALTSAIACERRRTCLSLDAMTEDSRGGAVCMLDLLSNARDSLDIEGAEVQGALDRAMRALRDRDRDALVLWLSGLTLQEIGIRHHTTGEAVRQRLHAALRRLRACLLAHRPAPAHPSVAPT